MILDWSNLYPGGCKMTVFQLWNPLHINSWPSALCCNQEPFLFSHFIHLFIIVINSWLPIFECFIIRYYTNYFGAQILCQLWPAGVPSTWCSWPAAIVFYKVVPYFLALHDIPGSSDIYSVKPWNEPFSKMLSFHTLGMVVEIKLWVPGAHYYWGTLLLSPFSRQSWVIETCIYTYANTYIHIHMHIRTYRYTCAHNHVYTYILKMSLHRCLQFPQSSFWASHIPYCMNFFYSENWIPATSTFLLICLIL